ncbi:PAS domain S-box protein [Roseomonas sp. KE2513]|uniref:sensor histidine kinase n=1 Tax=Roseomonas sp. KE2513 TaxID=2479202 RepID=UPI0018E05F8D|nr:HWE histidine kinase domain-containing protein [Roseomonas sp. KE2513]MBI0535917.1 PAS domain S-box protein [Roseomonas sp. KE2513]
MSGRGDPGSWPPDGGVTGEIARRMDWSATPLGEVSGWPPALRTAVEICLSSAFPCFVAWGPELTQVYNDAAVPLVRVPHPEAFGRPLRELWPDAWDTIGPLAEQVLTRGETVSREDFALPSSAGKPPGEERFTFSSSPLRDASGAVAGLFATVIETTRRVRAEDYLRRSEAQGAVLLAVVDRIRPLTDRGAILSVGAEALRRHLGLATAGYNVLDPPEADGMAGNGAPGGGVPPWTDRPLRLAELLPEAAAALRQGRVVALEAPGSGAAGLAVPLHRGGRLVAWFRATATGPRAWPEHERRLLREVAERVWEAAERAMAEAAAREGQRRLRSLLEGIPQLVWRAVDSGNWTWSSPQWSAYTGLSEAATCGYGWLAAVHPEDREAVMAAWRRCAAEEEPVAEFRAEFRLLHAGEGQYRWFQARAAPVRDEAGAVVEWLGTSTDVDELRRMGQHQRLLLAELQHRVRNTLSVIRSIIRRTVQASDNLDDLAMHLDGRIDAFSRVQAAVTRNPERGIDLAQLVADELLAYSAREGKQVHIQGPPVALRPKAAETLALALHELATNAVKFGALSQPQGRVEVAWDAELPPGAPRLLFRWREIGLAPAAEAPLHRGFGTELFERTLPYELNAEVERSLVPAGLLCTIVLPLSDRLVKEETLQEFGLGTPAGGG